MPALADAGQYTVWSCRGPDGSPISTDAWRTQAGDAHAGDIEITDDCASGGSLRIGVTSAGIPADRKPRGEAVFQLPRGAEISAYELWRYIVAAGDFPGAGYAYAAATREEGASSSFEWGCASGLSPPFFNCNVEGTTAEPLSTANHVTQFSSPLTGLSFWAGCTQVGCEPPFSPPSAEYRLFRSAVSIEDDTAPTVLRVEGAPAEPAPISGTAHLFVTAADSGGGVAAFEFSVDGGAPQRVAVADAANGCEEPYAEAEPCPREATRGLAIDTASLAPGAHSVSGSVVDAAGNASPFGPIAFTIAAPPVPVEVLPAAGNGGGNKEAGGNGGGARGGGRQPDNGTPAVETPRLRLQPAKSGAGPSARIAGTLTTPEGTPIAGARLGIEVEEVGAPRDGKKRFVQTDANGRFAFGIGGEGARNVVVSYAPIVGGGASTSAKTEVATKLALELSPRPSRIRVGQSVRFLGHLRGAGAAALGANVEIQAISGGRWMTVDTVPADAQGDFTWSHRFRYVDRDALFSFRAVVPRTPGWPWATVRSDRVELPIKGPSR